MEATTRQLERGWQPAKKIAAKLSPIILDLEPQDIESHTRAGSRKAANRWVEYVESVLSVPPSRLGELEKQVVHLQHELETSKLSPDQAEQIQGELQDIQDELRQIKVAEQKGIDIEEVKRKKRELAKLSFELFQDEPPLEIENELYFEQFSGEPIPDKMLVDYWHKAYLKITRADRIIKESTWDNLKRSLKEFVDFVGAKSPVTTITSKTIDDYVIHLSSQGQAKKKGCLREMRTFVKYLNEHDLIPLPKNITKHRSKTKRANPKHFNTDELKRLLNDTDGFLQLVIHLSANCGFYNIDIASTTATMLHDGYLTRCRHKTETNDEPMVVSWKLWPRTLELIDQHKTDNKMLFVQSDGNPWYLEKTETAPKRDFINERLWREFKKLHKPNLSLRFIRKTVANMIETNMIDSTETNTYSVQKEYLAQVPADEMLAAYVKPKQHEFDSVMDQLGMMLTKIEP